MITNIRNLVVGRPVQYIGTDRMQTPRAATIVSINDRAGGIVDLTVTSVRANTVHTDFVTLVRYHHANGEPPKPGTWRWLEDGI